MAIAQVQRQSFEDRLKRINSGGPNTMGEVHIGPRDEENARKGKANNTVRVKKSKRKPVKVGQGSSAILVPLAITMSFAPSPSKSKMATPFPVVSRI